MIREQQDRLRILFAAGRSSPLLAMTSSWADPNLLVGGDAGDVENQRDVPVAQDGRARETGSVLDVSAERLDDDLFRIVQGVDDDAEALLSALHDDDVRRRLQVALSVASVGQSRSRGRRAAAPAATASLAAAAPPPT
jgi:hypothetical protein